MKTEGILKGADRKEPNWKKTTLGEPFKKSLGVVIGNILLVMKRYQKIKR